MVEWMPLVPVDDLPDDLRTQWEQTERSGLRDFIRMMAHAPDHFRRYNDVYGRLVDVKTANDGSMLFTDDGAGTVWRVSYSGTK